MVGGRGPPPLAEEAGTDVEVGVAGLSGMLSGGGGARPRWPGDIPPGKREPGLGGTGNLGSGDGAGKLGRPLSGPPPGVCGVPGMVPTPPPAEPVGGCDGALSPVKWQSLVGVWGVWGPPGYFGGWLVSTGAMLEGV